MRGSKLERRERGGEKEREKKETAKNLKLLMIYRNKKGGLKFKSPPPVYRPV